MCDLPVHSTAREGVFGVEDLVLAGVTDTLVTSVDVVVFVRHCYWIVCL